MTTSIATTEETYGIRESGFMGERPGSRRDNCRTGQGLTEDDRTHLASVLGHEVSENTRKNYNSQWRRFTAWALARARH